MNKETKLKNYAFDQFKKSRENCTDEMYKNFVNYFDRNYSHRISKYINNDFMIYLMIQEFEGLFQLSDFEIQKVIVLDVEFEKILKIRKKIINIRINSKQNKSKEDSLQELNSYIELLEHLKNRVYPFNKEEAYKIYCDCLIDIDYIKGNSEIESL